MRPLALTSSHPLCGGSSQRAVWHLRPEDTVCFQRKPRLLTIDAAKTGPLPEKSPANVLGFFARLEVECRAGYSPRAATIGETIRLDAGPESESRKTSYTPC